MHYNVVIVSFQENYARMMRWFIIIMIYPLNTKNIAEIKWNRILYLREILDGVLIAFDVNFPSENLASSYCSIGEVMDIRVYPPKRIYRISGPLHNCNSDVSGQVTSNKSNNHCIIWLAHARRWKCKQLGFFSVFIYISNVFYFRYSNKNNIYLRSINESKLTRPYYNNAFQFLRGSALAFS